MNKMTSQQQLAAVAAKRQKTAAAAPRDVATSARAASDAAELFPGLPRVEYRPDAAPEDVLCFRFYNASERIHGRSMEDWLRPALSLGHALRPTGEDANGQPTFPRQPPWSDGTNSLENYQRRIRAAFELCGKLGIRHWAAWDRDLAPEGDTLEETQRLLEDSVDLCLELQQLQQRAGTSIRPLWLAADLHSHPRYCQGAGTAPDAAVVAMAGAQVRRALQAAQRLSADCFLFWGGREGYATPLNTDPARELRGYARLLRMTAEYRDRLGYRGQLLLETTPRPAAPRSSDAGGSSVRGFAAQCTQGLGHGSAAGSGQRRYDDCAAAAVCLLKQHGLDRHYKLSAPPGHQAVMSTAYGMLGCVNATSCAFPPDVRDATILMKTVVEQGGVQPGGLLVGVPLRRESLDSRDHARDVLAACVAVVDCYARALRAAVRIVADGAFSRNLQQRYLSFHNGFGARLCSGEATLEDCEDYARKHQHQLLLQQHGQAAAGAAGEALPDWCVQQGPQQGVSSSGSSGSSGSAGRPEHWEALCGRYVDAVAVAVADLSRE